MIWNHHLDFYIVPKYICKYVGIAKKFDKYIIDCPVNAISSSSDPSNSKIWTSSS